MCVVWGKPLGVDVGEGGWQREDSGWALWCLAQPGEFLNHCGCILTALHFLPCPPGSLLYLAAGGILFKMFSQIMSLLCSELSQSPALTKAAESPEFLCPVPLGLRPHCSFLLSFLALPRAAPGAGQQAPSGGLGPVVPSAWELTPQVSVQLPPSLGPHLVSMSPAQKSPSCASGKSRASCCILLPSIFHNQTSPSFVSSLSLLRDKL